MNTAAVSYQQALDAASITLRSTTLTCKIFSTALGRMLSTKDLSSKYWILNLCSTVQFSRAVKAAAQSYSRFALLELGPHPALKGPTLDTLAQQSVDREFRYFHSCHRGHSSMHSMLGSAVEMLAYGFDIRTSSINNPSMDAHVLTDLPSYPWDHSISHWGESRASRQMRFREYPRHPLLGARAFGDNPNQMFWRNRPNFEDLPMMNEKLPVSSMS